MVISCLMSTLCLERKLTLLLEGFPSPLALDGNKLKSSVLLNFLGVPFLPIT